MVWLCLLFFLHSLTAQVEFCPPYPRMADQSYFCFEVENGGVILKLEQSASLYNTVKFVFPSFTPHPAIKVTYLNVNFGDGMGPRAITSGSTVNITYSSPGRYPVTWEGGVLGGSGTLPIVGSKIFQSNQNSNFTYPVPAPDDIWDELSGTFTPPATTGYPSGSPYNAPTTAGGLVNIRYANPADPVLRKPFILLEGFDPILNAAEYPVLDASGNTLGFGSFRWDVLMTGRNESFDSDPNNVTIPHNPQFAFFPELVSQLQARGYDIVYVDFADGANYLQANAEFLIKVIEQVNAEKDGQEPNVLMGASMGGIICRYALAKMEQEGKDHCVGLLGTLDSPHNGANIPLALQALGWYFHASGRDERLWTSINTPAGRQMAIMQLGTEIQTGRVELQQYINFIGDYYLDELPTTELTTFNYSALRTDFLNTLQGLGWPKLPRKIAMLDGMENGTAMNNHGYGPGDKFYDINFFKNPLGTVGKVSMRSSNSNSDESYTIGLMDNCNEFNFHVSVNKMLFSLAFPSDFNPCNPLGLGQEKVPYKYHAVHLKSNSNLPALDNAPAGLRLDLTTLDADLRAEANKAGVFFQRNVYNPRISFVPTWSSLAMSTPLVNSSLFVDLTAPQFNSDNLPNALVPNFDNFYAPPANMRHAELDAGMVNFILAELDALGPAVSNEILDKVYNYGFRRTLIPNTRVIANGKLNINNTGPTGYIPGAQGGNATRNIFTTFLADCGQYIIVEQGGEFNIGAEDRSQNGITEVWEGSTVHIKSGGTLHITSDQSMLWIKSGAKLILDAGAKVYLESPLSRIRIDGVLEVNGNFTFQGRGHFDFHNDYGLRLGDQADAFRINAPLINRRSIRLSGNTRLHIPEGKGIDLNFGGVEYALDNHLVLDRGAWAETNGSWFVGLDKNATGISGENPGRLIIRNSFFVGVDAPIDITGADNFGTNLTQIKNTRFEDYNIGSHIAGRSVVLFDQCTLLGAGSEAEYGIFSEDNSIFVLRESDISGHTFGNVVVPNASVTYGLRAGLKVEYGSLVWMDGGEISGCDLGIANYDQNDLGMAVNVLMNHFATIRDCGMGIFMEGNETKGLVMMDCARLINNNQGIFGDDIRLLIDPQVIAKQNGTPVNPNVFIVRETGSNVNKYFNICYKQFPNPGQPIPAKMNYWGFNGVATGGIIVQNPDPLTDITLMRPLGQQPCTAVVMMDVSSPVTRPPAGCSIEEFCEVGNDCLEDCPTAFVASNATTVKGRFMEGYDNLKDEQFDQARSDFGDVAGLWQPDLTDVGYDQYCQALIHAGRSLAVGGSDLQRKTPVRTSPVSNINVLPNPATNSFSVSLPPDPCTLRVWDTFGHLVYEQDKSSNTAVIDASGWANGIYIIGLDTANGKQWGKVILQR